MKYMKSYNHLWETFIADGTIDKAISKAALGKRQRKNVARCLKDPDFKDKIKKYAENYHNAKHTPLEIYDGVVRKKRTIIVPSFPELVIQHMAVITLEPIFTKGMYEHSYGSIPKRGGHKGMKQVKRWIKHGGKNCKYCLKMDIKKYFDSVPHSILLDKLKALIHDKRFYDLLESIINITDIGIPLGFFLSQWLANWYLQDLDHYIKEELCAEYYIRYMDDMVIFGPNKRKLHNIRKDIEVYLNNKLGLRMKENWQVFLFHYVNKLGIEKGRFLDFMGFRFYRNRIVLRRSIMLRASRKARHISKKKKITIYDIHQFLSYIGWIDCTDTYNMYLTWIKPFVNIKNYKHRISNFDKRRKIV